MAIAYIVQCDDGTNYLCHTQTDAEARVREHYRKKSVSCQINTQVLDLKSNEYDN